MATVTIPSHRGTKHRVGAASPVQRKRLPDVADDALDGLGHAFGGGVNDEVWGDRRLVGGGDAGELGDLAGAGALVAALGVAPLAGRHVGLAVDLVEAPGRRGARAVAVAAGDRQRVVSGKRG